MRGLAVSRVGRGSSAPESEAEAGAGKGQVQEGHWRVDTEIKCGNILMS